MTFHLVAAVLASEMEERRAIKPFLINSEQQVLGWGKKTFHLSRDVILSIDKKLLLHKENLERALCSVGTTSGFEYVHPRKAISHNGPNSKHSEHKDP